MKYIRGVKEISFYIGNGVGILMSEKELLSIVGKDRLSKINSEIEDYGSSFLCQCPGIILKKKREESNLTILQLEELSCVPSNVLYQIESSSTNVTVWIYDHVAKILEVGLTELYFV